MTALTTAIDRAADESRTTDIQCCIIEESTGFDVRIKVGVFRIPSTSTKHMTEIVRTIRTVFRHRGIGHTNLTARDIDGTQTSIFRT